MAATSSDCVGGCLRMCLGAAPRLERVWLERLAWSRGSTRRGIDLVAEEHGGGLWAIQATPLDTGVRDHKKADLDSFLSESSRKEFASPPASTW